jgi:hypothetical protein
LAFLPNISRVPSLSAVKRFLLEKGQSGKTELPPGPKAKLQRKKDKVRMALSAPPNYQQGTKEIPLYGDIDSEEETSRDLPGAKKGTLPSSDSRSGENKSPDGGSATSEGEPGEDHSGLALTQLGSTSTPEHGGSSRLQEGDEGEIAQKAQDLQERLCWMEKQRVRDLKQI